jgi:7-cyano-7-deazaguanine reductase
MWEIRKMQEETMAGLTILGEKTNVPGSPEEALLERIKNEWVWPPHLVRFTIPEMTSLCPRTGQPDFCHLVIDYVPRSWLLESKSLKLFIFSFRNHGDFHEACTNYIATRIMTAIEPQWLRVGAYWYPRGGIPIDVHWQSGDPPAKVWIPDQQVPSYRGRG